MKNFWYFCFSSGLFFGFSAAEELHAQPADSSTVPQHFSGARPATLFSPNPVSLSNDPAICSAALLPVTIRMHIPKSFFQKLSENTLSNVKIPLCGEKNKSCISSVKTSSLSSPGATEHYLPDAELPLADVQFQTPLDIDLTTTTPDGPLWTSSASHPPIQIQIVLDDPKSMHFVVDMNGSSNVAVTQGNDGAHMFFCPATEGIDPITKNPMVTFRAYIDQNEEKKYGGLNIGVQFKSANGWVMPLFIDPQVKNNG